MLQGWCRHTCRLSFLDPIDHMLSLDSIVLVCAQGPLFLSNLHTIERQHIWTLHNLPIQCGTKRSWIQFWNTQNTNRDSVQGASMIGYWIIKVCWSDSCYFGCVNLNVKHTIELGIKMSHVDLDWEKVMFVVFIFSGGGYLLFCFQLGTIFPGNKMSRICQIRNKVQLYIYFPLVVNTNIIRCR